MAININRNYPVDSSDPREGVVFIMKREEDNILLKYDSGEGNVIEVKELMEFHRQLNPVD